MQIFITVSIPVLFILLLIIGTVLIMNTLLLMKVAKASGVIPEVAEKEKKEEEEKIKREESDKAFNNLLVELSSQKQEKDNEPFGTYTFDELDDLNEMKHTESDPEKLLTILEYGLPDEELEAIIKELEGGK